MRTEVLKFLRNLPADKIKQYNSGFDLFRQIPEANRSLIRKFNLGFSDSNLQSLLYELQKIYSITPVEILSKIQKPEAAEAPTSDTPSKPDPELLETLKKQKKLREEYPFLSDPGCPNEFKILVADKITAYEQFTQAHKELVDKYFNGEITEESDPGELEKLQELIKEAVDSFQLNRDIYEELDHYKENGKVLGKLPILADLKTKQEIWELPASELVKKVGNLNNYIRRDTAKADNAPTDDEKKKFQEKVEEWKKQLQWVNQKLNEEK